jgi:hypothetical protein
VSSERNRTGLLLFLAGRYVPHPSEHVARADAQRAQGASEQLA